PEGGPSLEVGDPLGGTGGAAVQGAEALPDRQLQGRRRRSGGGAGAGQGPRADRAGFDRSADRPQGHLSGRRGGQAPPQLRGRERAAGFSGGAPSGRSGSGTSPGRRRGS